MLRARRECSAARVRAQARRDVAFVGCVCRAPASTAGAHSRRRLARGGSARQARALDHGERERGGTARRGAGRHHPAMRVASASLLGRGAPRCGRIAVELDRHGGRSKGRGKGRAAARLSCARWQVCQQAQPPRFNGPHTRIQGGLRLR
eukprot:5921100-Prymnesium_polylepis.1